MRIQVLKKDLLDLLKIFETLVAKIQKLQSTPVSTQGILLSAFFFWGVVK